MISFFEPIIKPPLNRQLCLSKQIANRITQRYKEVKPEEEVHLPSARALGDLFDVSHGTIGNAYAILERHGLSRSYGSRGTCLKPYSEFVHHSANSFISVHEEEPRYRRLNDLIPSRQEVAVLEMSPESNMDNVVTKMQMAFRSTIRKKHIWEGSEEWLCKAIKEKLKAECLSVELKNIFIPSRGNSLMAVASVVLQAGDLVVMDTVQDFFPLGIFRSLGCEIETAGNEAGQGIDMRALEVICETRNIRLVFIRPDSSWPYGTVTSDEDRNQLISLSKKFDFKIIAFEFESDYSTVKLSRRLSERQHGGRLIFISVVSRASRAWEQTSYVVAEPELIKILKEHDALFGPPRYHSFEQITAVMYENGSLGSEARKLSYGHKKRLQTIAGILEPALKKNATVIKPQCGRFIIIQFHKPIHVKHVTSLSVHQNLNYYERNKHLKEDQTVRCLRVEYTVFKRADWEILTKNLLKLLHEKPITIIQDEESSALFEQKPI